MLPPLPRFILHPSSLILLLPSVVLACPNCKDSVAATDLDAATQVGAAFNYSIFAMLAAVFLTATFVGRTLYKASQSHPGAIPPDARP